MVSGDPRISLLGANALLFDVSGKVFEQAPQQRVWSACRAAIRLDGVKEAVPGMNNLMVVFEDGVDPEQLSRALNGIWRAAKPLPETKRLVEAPTIYGGEAGRDLAELAERTGLTAAEVARLHAAQTYSVAAVGAMPGFVYLSGLDPRLSWPRLANPRSAVPQGSVIIGGMQTGILPINAPTGWRGIGHTALRLFDPGQEEPALLRPGDRLKFTILDVLP